MCDVRTATRGDDTDATCQFCQKEFKTYEDLCEHVKDDCKIAEKCRTQVITERRR